MNRLRRTLICAALIMTAAAGLAGQVAAEPGVAMCHIGKPSYCLKYAQMFCLKENSRDDREQSCPAWERACLACHARVPECLGGKRPSLKSEPCGTCTKAWTTCMHEIDKKLWPNRRKPPRSQ